MTETVYFLDLHDVLERVKLSKATLYRKVRGREFPAPRKVGRLSRWVEDEVTDWQLAQVSA